CQHYNSLPLTC
nr:immunoglobulin light chain junction region [Macaca mulatta]MPN92521.1 immunoglobulin light chain junction region [Macaca mulatta]